MQGDIVHPHVYVAIVLVPIFAFLLGAGLWSWSLRRQVARRTKELDAEASSHQQAEARARHLNSVLRAIRNVNQLITRENDRDALMNQACELLVETRGYHSAWLVLLDENNRPVKSAQAGLGAEFGALLEQMESGNLSECSERALAGSGVVVADDPESGCDDGFPPGRHPGFGALTVRLEHSGRVFGLLSVEIPDHLVFDGEEQQLVKEMADDLAFALHAAEAREEHERADRALHESEKRLIAAQHIAGMGDFTWYVETGEVTWSDALFDLLGYDKSDFIDYSKVNAEIHHPDDLADVTVWLHDCIASGQEKLVPNEYRIIRKDGETIFVRTVGIIEREEGKQAKVFATVQDITERKRAEEKLRESEHNLLEAQQLTNIGSWVWNLDTNEVVCSDEMFKIWGYSPEKGSLTLEKVMTRIHTEDRDRVSTALQNTIEGDVPYEAEFRLALPDGVERFIHGMGRLVRDDEGKPGFVRGTGQDITERKRGERLLQAREEFLDSVIEQSPFAIWISDSEGTLQRANPALKKFLNLSDEQLVGKYNVLHDPVVELQGLIPLIRTVYEEGASISFTCDWDGEDIPTLDLKGSSSVSIEATMFPIHGPEGDITNVVLNWIDVTERKQAADALRESEERYRRIFNDSAAALWEMDFSAVREYVEELKKQGMKDLRGHMTSNPESFLELQSRIGLLNFNDTTLSMFRANTREELLDSFGDLLIDDSKESFLRCVKAFDAGELVYNSEQRHKGVDGEDILVDLTALVVPGSEETWNRVLITVQDITDRKMAEEALGERVKELTCLYAVSRDLQKALTIDELCHRVFEHLTPAMKYPEITVPLVELNGRQYTSENHTEGLSHGLHSEIQVHGEARGLLSVYYTEERPFLISEEQSLVNGVAEFLGSWLERRQAETSLRAYSERLEEMVEERTLELQQAQERLIRQEKLAILGQLAGGVGHELRNPLGAIKNAAYFLNMVLQDPDVDTWEMLGILDKEVDTAEEIISSLLDFAGTRPPVRCEVDLNDIVRETMSRTPLPDTTHIEVELQLDDDLPLIVGDPDQLSQVFDNIIRNAVQAMPPLFPPRLRGGGEGGALSPPAEGTEGRTEGGHLVIKSQCRGDPDGRSEWVTVSVTDSGEGIPEENLEKIFEPLFTTKAKGIGLGLALVKTLVEGHGGETSVESRLGEGSTFTVSVPISRAEE